VKIFHIDAIIRTTTANQMIMKIGLIVGAGLVVVSVSDVTCASKLVFIQTANRKSQEKIDVIVVRY
jgi:hypothetical protein